MADLAIVIKLIFQLQLFKKNGKYIVTLMHHQGGALFIAVQPGSQFSAVVRQIFSRDPRIPKGQKTLHRIVHQIHQTDILRRMKSVFTLQKLKLILLSQYFQHPIYVHNYSFSPSFASSIFTSGSGADAGSSV